MERLGQLDSHENDDEQGKGKCRKAGIIQVKRGEMTN